MPLNVTAGQIPSAGSRTAIKSAEITAKTALNMGQRLSVKPTKIGTCRGIFLLPQEIVQ